MEVSSRYVEVCEGIQALHEGIPCVCRRVCRAAWMCTWMAVCISLAFWSIKQYLCLVVVQNILNLWKWQIFPFLFKRPLFWIVLLLLLKFPIFLGHFDMLLFCVYILLFVPDLAKGSCCDRHTLLGCYWLLCLLEWWMSFSYFCLLK